MPRECGALMGTTGQSRKGRRRPRARSAPDLSCCGVAPARIASAMTMASEGITGPNGTLNTAGLTVPANRGWRSRIVAAHVKT